MPIRSKESRYCFLRDSTDVKDMIKFRMKELNVTVLMLSKELGILPNRIYRYLRLSYYHNPGESSVTQYQLIQIAKHLGIELTIGIHFTTTKPVYGKP